MKLQNLKISSQEMLQLFDELPMGLAITSMDGHLHYCNQAYASIVGYSIQEIHQLSYWDLTPEKYIEGELQQLECIELSGSYGPYEKEYIHKSGQLVPVRLSGKKTHIDGVPYIWSSVEEISDLKKVEADLLAAQKVLEDSEYRFRVLHNASFGGITIHDQGIILECNQGLSTITGYSYDELIGKDGLLLIAEDYRDFVKSQIKAGVEEPYEAMGVAKDGRIYPIRLEARNIPYKGKDVRVVEFRDITQEKEAENELSKNQYYLERSQSIAHIGTWSLDLESGDLYWSDEIFNIFGFGKDDFSPSYEAFLNAILPEDRDKVNQAYTESIEKNQDTYSVEHRVQNQTTKEIRIVIENCIHERNEDNKIIRSIGTIQDITENRKMEEENKLLQEQLIQSQKMKAIGTLAGGIAHDFNNILSAISGTVEISLQSLDSPKFIEENLNAMMTFTERASALVKQILDFSRAQQNKQVPLSIPPIISEVVHLVKASFPSTVTIKTHIEKSEYHVLANSTQIFESIMNLCTNAFHALKEKKGEISIFYSEENLEQKVTGVTGTIPEGLYTKISVSDTGVGIKDDVLNKIFEPFFTTKKVGQGSGMGLSVIYGIVKSHKGTILVQTKENIGTTFTIYLPATPESPEKNPIAEISPPKILDIDTKNSKIIVFIDDEESIRNIVSLYLKKQGYKVASFTSATEACEIIMDPNYKMDVLITDHTMPGMTGEDLIIKFRACKPSVPIILCTGYTDSISSEIQKEVEVFLTKPYKMSDIGDALNQLLIL